MRIHERLRSSFTRGRAAFAPVLFSLALTLLFGGQAHAQCERVPDWLAERKQLKEELARLEEAVPFLEKFEEVHRAVTLVHKVLQETRGDLEDLTKFNTSIDSLLGTVTEQNQGMSNVQRWARSAYSNPAWEPKISIPTDDGITLSGGLIASTKWMKELDGQVGTFKKGLDELDKVIRAREGHPSEQLDAFKTYFNSIGKAFKALLAAQFPFAKPALDMIKVNITLLDPLIENVKSIEKEYARRDEILKQLGSEFDRVRHLRKKTTPWERLHRQRRAVEEKIKAVEQRLEECGIEPDIADPAPADKNVQTEIDRARSVADRACGKNFDVDGEYVIARRRTNALRRVQKHYERPHGTFFPAKYGAEMTTDEVIDDAMIRHNSWKEEKLRRIDLQSTQLQQKHDEIDRRFQKYRAGELTLSSFDAGQLNMDRNKALDKLEAWPAEEAKLRQAIERRDADVQALREAEEAKDDYKRCLRKEMDGLAEQMGWDPYWMHEFNPDLYDPRLDPKAWRPAVAIDFEKTVSMSVMPEETVWHSIVVPRATEFEVIAESADDGRLTVELWREATIPQDVYRLDPNMQDAGKLKKEIEESGRTFVRTGTSNWRGGKWHTYIGRLPETRYRISIFGAEWKRDRKEPINFTLRLIGRDRGDLGTHRDAGRSRWNLLELPAGQEFTGYLMNNDWRDRLRIRDVPANTKIRITLGAGAIVDDGEESISPGHHSVSVTVTTDEYIDGKRHRVNVEMIGARFDALYVEVGQDPVVAEYLTTRKGHYDVTVSRGYGGEAHTYTIRADILGAGPESPLCRR